LSGISALALATSAFAQQAAGEVESVVVTATRIQTNGYTAPTPVTVAPIAELMETTPTNIPDALNKLPQFAGSASAVGNGNGAGSGPSNVFTGNYLNLRNMGAIRTLILLDGRRVPPTAGNGQVDTNTLPQQLVQRVDVVTGGASAVYGSDAVTGVVNFILDNRYKGFKAQVQKGISDRGDVPQFKVGFAGGVGLFEDRGHFIFSAEHFQNAGLKRIEDRDYLNNTPVFVGAGTAQNPYVYVENARLARSAFGGLALTGPFAGQQFVGSGTLAPFNVGTPTVNAGLSIGGDGIYYYGAVGSQPLRNDQVFGRFEYEFSPNVTGFMQMSWSESGNSNFRRSNSATQPFTIFSGNAFLPANAQAQLTATNTPSFVLERFVRDIALQTWLNQVTTSLNFTTGLKGSLGGKYNWEAYYTHGESRVRSRRNNNINWRNFAAAIDAVRAPNGDIVCRVAITNPGLYPGCQPLNIFGQLNASPQSLDYIFEDTNFQILNKMDNFAASIAGDVLQGWAGPLSMAANFEYRQQSMTQTTTANPNDVLNQTGIRIGAPLRQNYAFDLLAPQYGHNSVWEASGEAALPLLVDAPFVKRLDMSGAVRYTEYSSSGPATTWKVGLNYEPFEDLRFRYTESRDIRAPTLLDLYSGATVAAVSFNDTLHTGRTGTSQLRGGGNPDLVPEVSRTTTIGAVYRPSWFPRFQMSVDYFDIRMRNGITTLAGTNSSIQREC
jgi:outer membrane receptor protein involved in Fe transport